MKQLILNVKDNKLKFFLELINDFDFIQVESEGYSKEAILANVSQGLKDVKKLQDGNLKTRPAKELLDEL